MVDGYIHQRQQQFVRIINPLMLLLPVLHTYLTPIGPTCSATTTLPDINSRTTPGIRYERGIYLSALRAVEDRHIHTQLAWHAWRNKRVG